MAAMADREALFPCGLARGGATMRASSSRNASEESGRFVSSSSPGRIGPFDTLLRENAMTCVHLRKLYQLCQEEDLRLGGSDLIRIVCQQCGVQDECPSLLLDEFESKLPPEEGTSATGGTSPAAGEGSRPTTPEA